MSRIRTSAVVAMAENRCIGDKNDLPWHIPADLKRFKSLTVGKPVIMGRKTFQSIVDRIGKPLPGRTNIVISRSGFEYEGVLVCHDLETALTRAKKMAVRDSLDEIIIGGGAQIYEKALPYTDRVYLTVVHTNVEGDAFFPVLSKKMWKETDVEDHEATEGQHPSFTTKCLERKN